MDDAERDQLLSRLDRMKLLIADLDRVMSADERLRLRDRLNRELDAVRTAAKTLGTHNRH